MVRGLLVVLSLASPLGAVPLRVATFNIETHRNADGWPDYALDEPGTVDFDSVAAILARIDADVVALQEIHTSDINEGDLDALGAVLGLGHRFASVNSGNFDTSLRVAFLSRHPFLATDSIVSPPGAKEIARHCPAVVVDVPGTANDPLLISAHLKSGTTTADRFRRAVEMKRLADHLAGSGYGAAGNFIVLGDFNPSGVVRDFATPPPGLPTTFVLGGDIGFPVSYSTDMVSYFADPVPTRLDPRQLNGSAATYEYGQTLDLLLVSPALAGRPHALEIYRSSLDVSNSDGLPKAGQPLPAATSAEASDHFAVFADFELDQAPFNLALAASAPDVAEGDPPGSVTLTATLAEPSTGPVTVTFASDDAAAVPVDAEGVIDPGDLSASTAIATSRDYLAGGVRTVTFRVSASGYAAAETSLQLLDSDSGYHFRQPGEAIVENFDGFAGNHPPAPWSSDAADWLGSDDGGSAEPGARSYGPGGDGAPGFVSGGGSMVLETSYTHGAAVPLTLLDLAYDAAQWRSAPGGAADRIEVELLAGGVVIPLPELGFAARTDLPAGPVAGGAPVRLSTRVAGLEVPPGGAFTLRFRFVPGPGAAPPPADLWINEFHYDNSGTDVGEFVEVVAGPGFSADLSTVELRLYNGSDGGVYGDPHPLDTFIGHPPAASGHRLFSKSIPGIQNGAPDGMALVVGGVVAEFLSYEGSFIATDGPANGMTSVDVGVSQATAPPAGGQSIGRTGIGGVPGDFPWVRFGAGVAHSPGSLNQGQAILSPGVPSQGLAVDRVTAVFVEDADGDGLADEVDEDDDNDGLSDADELAFGTDPLDPGSVFRVRAAVGAGGPELRFPGAEGVVYTIEWGPDLVSWDQSAQVEGEGAEVVFALPAGGGRIFARVRAGAKD